MIHHSEVLPGPPTASEEEMLAGALALMTAHAQASVADKRSLARTIAVQVQRLASGRTLSAEFKVALAVLAAHWAALAEDPSPQHLPDGDRQLWHPAPVSLQ
jgi:hypothetical protein